MKLKPLLLLSHQHVEQCRVLKALPAYLKPDAACFSLKTGILNYVTTMIKPNGVPVMYL